MADHTDNTHNFNEFFRLLETPIEPGLVLVLIELERLYKEEDHTRFYILQEWIIEKLGRPVLAAYISSCYPCSNDEDYTDDADWFRVPEEYLTILNNDIRIKK
jgi:hypothetical protein